MRDKEEIRKNPSIIEELIERWNISDKAFQYKGFCKTKHSRKHARATVKFTQAYGWEHLSVSFEDEMPSWDVLQEMKEIFWKDEEEAIQIHPKKSEYINNHPYCLHLWRPTDQQIPLPPYILVGFRGDKYKEEDIQYLMKVQEELGSPMTREKAEMYYDMTRPEVSKTMREMNLALEHGNLESYIYKMLGGIK